MNQDWPDPTLARLFDRQRAADQCAAPTFARVCAPTPPRRYRLRAGLLANALVLAAGSVLATSPLWLRPRENPTGAPATGSAAVSTFSISTWQAPTDALLQNYAETSFTTLPSFGTAWTDALIAPTGAAPAIESR